MVASNREIVNINPFKSPSAITLSSSTMPKLQALALPTVSPLNYTGMDISTGQVPANNCEVRGRTPTTALNLSRESSMASSGWATPYYDRMDDKMDCESTSRDMTPELSYETEQEKTLHTSKAADQQDPMRPMSGNNEASPIHASHKESIINIQLPYNPQAPMEPDLWNRSFHPISLHGLIEHFASDSKSIKDSLNFMAKYITNKQVNSKEVNDLKDFNGMGDAIWNFISSVYKAKWDTLHMDNNTNTLKTKISSKFTLRAMPSKNNNKKEIAKLVPISIEKAPPPPPLLPAKSKTEINTISKYFKGNKTTMNSTKPTKSYTQASKQTASTSKVLKIKESFLALNTNQIDWVNNIIKGNPKPKPHIQMTTKGLSRKQVIVPMSNNNNNSFIKNSATHITNINRLLRNDKSEVAVDFIRSNPIGLVIVTNKVAIQSDLQIIGQYIKKSEDINELQVEEPRLPQSKSYLKIIGIPFFPNGKIQERLNASDVETILKQNQIFDDIKLVSRPRVIKVLPKSDMSIVWIDIWDYQSGSKARCLINQCFNIGRYITTIRGANMNSGMLQCKNCWRWGNATFSCRIQGSKCIKCNGPHKSKNHCEFGWCCKVNKKTNPPRLETKKGEPCPYSFKCSNCGGEHQADSNQCLFWRYQFNRE